MFEQSILTRPKGGRRFVSTCLGVTGEALVVACVVIVPMLWPQVLPRPADWVKLYTPTVPRPLGTAHLNKTHVEPQPHAYKPHGFMLPVSVPKGIYMKPEEPVVEAPEPGAVLGSPNIGSPDGVRGIGLPDFIAANRPAPAYKPPDPKPAAPNEAPKLPVRINQGGLVQAAKLIAGPKPAYPPLAKAAGISGVVELAAVIGTDGRLAEISVKSGHPLLVPAAVAAVRQWVYKPTFLNGDPVEVSTTIIVTFTLAR